jgi:hypothetical protein
LGAEWSCPPFELTNGGHFPPQVFVGFLTVHFQQELRVLLQIVEREQRRQQLDFLFRRATLFASMERKDK